MVGGESMAKIKFTSQIIRHAFRYRLQGSQRMKKIVCDTVAIFPEEIIKHVVNKCWFVSSFEESWAFVLRGDELNKDEHLIFLSDDLLQQDVDQIRWTIAHEIGHVILEHKNAILERQSKADIKKQEREADEFANRYLYKNR